MFRRFLADRRGNYMMMTAITIVPIMGALAVAIDYTEMSRQRQLTLNALDAANVATARRLIEGSSTDDLVKYANEFFVANLDGVDPGNAKLKVQLPTDTAGGGKIKLIADFTYKPYFLPSFADQVALSASSELQLKNTLEVALVLDNSGSMDYTGSGSGKKRIALLKDAAKQLVDTLAQQGTQIKQLDKAVQFALVPFAASVNVGPDKANASWMDTKGLSPVHHENFDWSTMSQSQAAANGNRYVQNISGIWYKKGAGWKAQENQIVSRFSMYNDVSRITGTTRQKTGTTTERKCGYQGWTYTCWNETVDVYEDVPTLASYASWAGCVETRPHPYDKDNTVPNANTPATLFVPMYAPDEVGNVWTKNSDGRVKTFSSANSWWDDLSTSTSTTTANQLARQKSMVKYFTPAPQGTMSAAAQYDDGPNQSCTTKPITPLTDVTKTAGLNGIKAAIDAMGPLGGTNVPEGIAWGWRVVSGSEPFTEGRPDHERGNDKVVIVLTDGENTYYTPSSLGSSDNAGMKSIYSAYGYTGVTQSGGNATRLFMGTSGSVSKTDFSNDNYSKAMNEQMAATCTNAKTAGVIVMTVALDLSTSNAAQKAQIDGLKACSSDSRFRKDATDPSKPAKLFWNSTGGDLSKTFKEIADELSNLRFVS